MKEQTITSDHELLELANSLGQPVPSRINGPLIDNLVPLKSIDAHKQSLSANYGFNDFPFHTDGAYFKTPPRLIILRYIKGIQDPTPTVICDLNNLSKDDKDILKHFVWRVKSREGDFLTTILSQDNKIFRYDKCIMQPAISINDNSQYFENVIRQLPIKKIQWTLNKTIVLDNWTNIHSRPQVKNEEIDYRTLQRIMVL